MLTKIELTNFKCFRETTNFPLGKLTLLTGVNGCGKSSLLQSLLLMRQSITHNENTVEVLLNGECLNLNSFNDIRNTHASRNEPVIFKYFFELKVSDSERHVNKYLGTEFKISVTSENKDMQIEGDIEYFLNEKLDDDRVAKIETIKVCSRIHEDKTEHESLYKVRDTSSHNHLTNEYQKYTLNGESLIDKLETHSNIINLIPDIIPSNRGKAEIWLLIYSAVLQDALFAHIHYISADRLGPQEYYPKSNLGRFLNVGARGQFTVNLLYTKRNDLINQKLCLGEDAQTLATQTEEWMSKIFNGAKVEVPPSESNILDLLFNTSTSKDRFRPANVGYGYHCTLPIVVSGLIAQAGEILIVENPEAHLHPRAQSEIAKFLAKVSSLGVQVFIESHSDHILNSLRVAVLDGIITSNDLSVLYFQKDAEEAFVQIPVQPNGGIEQWPEGFFDQMDRDFSRLFGI